MQGFKLAIALALIVTAASSAHAANITEADWGKTADGGKIQLFTLTGPKGLEARITNYGGMIVSLMVPNKQGT